MSSFARQLDYGTEARMNVLVADVMGMCFGVRDALDVIGKIERPGAVTIHGELVHNEAVLTDLHGRGFHMADEGSRQALAATDTVLITAHGIRNREPARLENAGQ